MMVVNDARSAHRWFVGVAAFGIITAVVLFVQVGGAPAALAATPTVGMGSAGSFAVLAGTTVTNTGPSVISGNLGVSPGSAVTGFPPGQVQNGAQHVADAVALQAQSDLTTGYNDAAGRTPATVLPSSELGGMTLVGGVYKVASGLGLTGTVTLNGQGDPNAVFIFQAGSTLITGSGSTVNMIGGAKACNVFWQVGSSATLGTNTNFVGTIMALTSVSVQTQATVAGRVLARNGQVSLDNNKITGANCAATSPSSSPAPSPSTTTAVPPAATPTTGPTAGAVIPSGHPQTGAGGTYRSGNGVLTAVGVVALIGAAYSMRQAVRRRRAPAGKALGDSSPGRDG
jgi:type VI secretion system secreted protein VgrG